MKLNNKGLANAKKLIKAGKVDNTSAWSFDAEDGNKILGDDNWSQYGKWFLGVDDTKESETKEHYKFPYGKDGKVYRKAITAIRQRAAQFKHIDIFDAAGELIDILDDKKSIKMNQNKPENIEVRNFTASELRIENAESREVVGYGSVFNSLSENLGGFRERIDERAFDDVLENDVRALFNHDSNYILGRTTANTLKLSVDEKGLRYSVNIPATSYGDDLMVSLDRGDITQNSFGFIVEEDDWTQDEEGNTIRTIKKVSRLLDVSLVTYPAYPSATIAKRGFLEYRTELEKKENIKEEKDLIKRNLLEKKIELLKLKNQD